MGWWETADGCGIVGDGPVDNVIGAYRRLHAHWQGTARCERPPRALFAGALQALRAAGGPVPDWELTEESEAPWTDAEIAIVADTLRRVRIDYEDSELERPPTERELYETIDFAAGELELSAASGS